MYAYIDTLPHPINQGQVVRYFATRPEGALLFTQRTLSRKLKERPEMEARMQSHPNALSCKRPRVVTSGRFLKLIQPSRSALVTGTLPASGMSPWSLPWELRVMSMQPLLLLVPDAINGRLTAPLKRLTTPLTCVKWPQSRMSPITSRKSSWIWLLS